MSFRPILICCLVGALMWAGLFLALRAILEAAV